MQLHNHDGGSNGGRGEAAVVGGPHPMPWINLRCPDLAVVHTARDLVVREGAIKFSIAENCHIDGEIRANGQKGASHQSYHTNYGDKAVVLVEVFY